MELFRFLLLLLPYFIIPSAVAYFSKSKNLFAVSTTYVLTAFLIFCYPFLFFWIDHILNPRIVKCLNPEFAVVAFNSIVMIPVSLLLQFIFNKLIKN